MTIIIVISIIIIIIIIIIFSVIIIFDIIIKIVSSFTFVCSGCLIQSVTTMIDLSNFNLSLRFRYWYNTAFFLHSKPLSIICNQIDAKHNNFVFNKHEFFLLTRTFHTPDIILWLDDIDTIVARDFYCPYCYYR